MIEKASEFAASAESELTAGRRTAAGLAAVHAGITAADAITACLAGVVSSAPDHGAVIVLLKACIPGGLPGPNERQLMGLLRTKNDIEYSERTLTSAQAHVLVDQAARFCAWGNAVVRERAP